MVNPVDAGIISFLNHFARRSWAFDTFFVLCSNYLLRAAGIVPLYWWAWFREGDAKTEKRRMLLFGMVSCLLALFLSRLISAVLPFRLRPIHNPELHFQAPYGQGTQMLLHWSSFPSDHAAVYFALATCLYFVSRQFGIFALCWALFVTCLPRIYLGLHYPSDILAGALLGVGVAYLSRVGPVYNLFTRRLMTWGERHPGPFYALLFLFSLQLATAFESVLVFHDYISAIAHHAGKMLF
jgi:undecaprenyl-diphosphatase